VAEAYSSWPATEPAIFATAVLTICRFICLILISLIQISLILISLVQISLTQISLILALGMAGTVAGHDVECRREAHITPTHP
jgi:hypothetical protein